MTKRVSMRLDPAERDFLKQLRAGSIDIAATAAGQLLAGKKELRSQEFEPDAQFDGGIPQPVPFSEASEAYAVHVWVYACVRAIATAATSVDILPYLQDAEGQWSVNEKHAFHKLLQNPNPYMTGRNLREFTFLTQPLTGNAYYALERMGGKEIREIWPLPAGLVKPVSSKTKFVDHYIYEVNGQRVRFEAEEIMHFRDASPTSLHYGQGGIQPVINSITADLNAMMWNKAFFANGAKLDGVLETDKSLDTDVKRKLMAAWKKMYAGNANNGSTAIMDGGVKYRQLTANIKDMDFVNLRKQVRDEILATFNVPPSVVGLLEFANYSNMKEQMRAFWTNNILPRLTSYSDTLTLRARQTTGDAKTVFQADTSTVEALRTNEKERADTVKTYVDSGIPINDVIDKLDLPFEAVEGGDVPRAPVAPGFGAATAAEPPPPPAKGLTKAVKADAEALREAAWKAFDRQLVPHEEAFITSMRGFFKGQRRRVVQAVEAHAAEFAGKAFPAGRGKAVEDTVRVVFDVQKENDLLERAADRHIRGTYFDFAVTTAAALKPGFNFNLQDPFALAWIQAKKVKLAQAANAYTLEQISDAVVEGVGQAVAGGFGAGETIAQITDRIDEVYKFAVDSRAERVARTEVIAASNAGAFDAMEKTGVERKGWLSSRDAKVRETHKAIEEAGPVGLREPFVSPSGAALQYPGDPAGGPGEVVNCRCALVARPGA